MGLKVQKYHSVNECIVETEQKRSIFVCQEEDRSKHAKEKKNIKVKSKNTYNNFQRVAYNRQQGIAFIYIQTTNANK